MVASPVSGSDGGAVDDGPVGATLEPAPCAVFVAGAGEPAEAATMMNATSNAVDTTNQTRALT